MLFVDQPCLTFSYTINKVNGAWPPFSLPMNLQSLYLNQFLDRGSWSDGWVLAETALSLCHNCPRGRKGLSAGENWANLYGASMSYCGLSCEPTEQKLSPIFFNSNVASDNALSNPHGQDFKTINFQKNFISCNLTSANWKFQTALKSPFGLYRSAFENH